MITFLNNAETIEVIVDNSDIPGQFQPNFLTAFIRKKSVSRVALDISETFVSIHFQTDKPYQLTFEFIDPQHNCSNNVELYELLKSYF